MCLVKRASDGGIAHRPLDEHGDNAYSKKLESEEFRRHMKDQNDETLRREGEKVETIYREYTRSYKITGTSREPWN